jgi:hypothetical protein
MKIVLQAYLEVLDSNLNLDTGYLGLGFLSVSQ